MMTVHLSCALTSQHLQWYNNEWLMIANSKSQLLTCVVRGRNVDGNYRRQISHVISTYYKNCHSQSLSFKLWYGFCTPPLITTFCTHCQTPGSSPWCRGSSAMTQASQPNWDSCHPSLSIWACGTYEHFLLQFICSISWLRNWGRCISW